MGLLHRINNANQSECFCIYPLAHKHQWNQHTILIVFNESLIFRLPSSLGQYWRCCFQCSDSVHATLISTKCSSGCGIFHISALDFMAYLILSTEWIGPTCGAQNTLSSTIATFVSPKYSCVKWASANSIRTTTFISWPALSSLCTYWRSPLCGSNWTKDERQEVGGDVSPFYNRKQKILNRSFSWKEKECIVESAWQYNLLIGRGNFYKFNNFSQKLSSFSSKRAYSYLVGLHLYQIFYMVIVIEAYISV